MSEQKVFVSGVSSDFRLASGCPETGEVTITFDAGNMNQEITKRLFLLLESQDCTLGDLVRAITGETK